MLEVDQLQVRLQAVARRKRSGSFQLLKGGKKINKKNITSSDQGIIKYHRPVKTSAARHAIKPKLLKINSV